MENPSRSIKPGGYEVPVAEFCKYSMSQKVSGARILRTFVSRYLGKLKKSI